MKIRNKLLLTFVVIALLYMLIGFIGYLYIEKTADSFRSLKANTMPSLISLLESGTATRRASLMAIEYSMRGNPGDREKSEDAMQVLERQLKQYQQLNSETIDTGAFRKLSEAKGGFINQTREFLAIAEDSAIIQVFEEEEKLQNDRINLIKVINGALEKDPNTLNNNLLKLKSDARIVSMQLIEFALRGNSSDKVKAQNAIETLTAARDVFLADSLAHPQLAQTVSGLVDAYIETARRFYQLMSSRKKDVESIYSMEASLQNSQNNLIETLSPHIDAQYLKLAGMSNLTSTQLDWFAQLQLYSVLLVTLISVVVAYLLARSVAIPLKKLNDATRQIGTGNLDVELDIHSRDEVGELAGSFREMVVEVQQQHDQLEHIIALRNKELEELRLAENSLEEAQRIAHIGNWELNIKADTLSWSDEVFRIFNFDKNEFIPTYKGFLKAVHPEDREKVNQAYLDSLKQKQPYEIEHRLVTKEGLIKYVNEKCETVFDRDGNPTRSIGTVQDITERLNNESLAIRMKHMLDHSIEEIYIFEGNNLRFIQVSRGALINLGYSMDEIRTLTPLDLKPDFTEKEFSRLIEPLRNGKKDQLIFETRHRRKNGSNYPVEVRLQYTREDVSPVFLAIILDLTERKLTEKELELYRQHLEQLVEERTATIKLQASIIDQTHDSVITTDLEGMITSWNGGAERLYCITAGQAIGQHIRFIYPENTHHFLEKNIIEPLKLKGSHELEVIMKRGDESEFPAHLSLSMLYDKNGRPNGMVGYSIDLSEQKQKEEKLTLLTRQLQDSNRELEAFSYSVSHDLRSPLRSIDGFSLALVEDYGDQLDDTALDYLNRVRKAAQRMGELIDDLLQLSRVNRTEFTLETADLYEIAQNIFSELEGNEPDRKVNISIQPKILVQGDVRLLRIVLDNLLGNAWKFTCREEQAEIFLGTLPGNPEVIYIRDNGVGFDMRHADKLFGVFQRLHQATEFPGTGVGLATVQRIIHRHGGQIWAESEQGKGATFFFTLKPSIITPMLKH